MPTELIWDGKYNADGTRRAPLQIALPFQTIEMVNESAPEHQTTPDRVGAEQPAGGWRNRLIRGDTQYVLPSLLPEFAGKINLIYIDPPFATGEDFAFKIAVDGESLSRQPSMLAQKAYRDTWGPGLDRFLQWFYETVVWLHQLLADDGCLYVHLDEHGVFEAKLVLDELFGREHFLNDIIWYYADNFQGNLNRFANNHNTILVYGKSPSAKLKRVAIPLGKTIKRDVRVWDKANQRVTAARDEQGNILYREYDTKFADDVWSIGQSSVTKQQSHEFLGYPTQKPEELLRRVIESASNEGDLVLDCFCGSGTTAAVAEKLGRRWIACDLGRFAIHTTRKRLLGIPAVQPFVVQNLAPYERQHWQADKFGSHAAQRVAAYISFILDLYHARPLNDHTWLHGIRDGRAVHVGAVDVPVTQHDVASIVGEWQQNQDRIGAASHGIDILGWEFAFEPHELARHQAQAAGADLRFLRIPREVLEQQAVEQGEIRFLELASFFVEQQVRGRILTLELTRFIAPLEYVPPEVRERITDWRAWIDYWAVDFDYQRGIFHNQWHSYRTRKDTSLTTRVEHGYDGPGTYQVQVQVVDILGHATTRTVQIVVE